ncbi:unnamed protein product [Linum trigynum]|uniref:PsbP C-terminal domain-containing protein n=1 Tax=Linum trigynum TaxID=586398 RepID=A0AAV2F6G2_9ROSI
MATSIATTATPVLPQSHRHFSAVAAGPTPKPPLAQFPKTQILTTLTATFAAATILTAGFPSLAEPSNYSLYYGTAASAANYGGYGGNSDKKASSEYGTNGTDSEFFNPKKKAEKEYLTFLAGFRQLAPRDAVLDNLALSDVDLQDLIATAEGVASEERKDESGQVYYEYEIDGVGKHSLIKVTCARNKLYAHFVSAPAAEWNRDRDTLRHLHESFKTVG